MNKKIIDLKNNFERLSFRYISNNWQKIQSFGENTDVVFKWEDEKILERCNAFLKQNLGTVLVDDFIDIDNNILDLLLIFKNNYLPSKNVCSKILQVVQYARKISIQNFEAFKGLSESETLWDLFVNLRKYEKDPHDFNNFQCMFLNDNLYFYCANKYANNHCYYYTGERFSGFLAHLFYSGYFELYNEMFSIIIDTIKKHPFDTMPLPYFLYTFCKINDDSKCKMILELINEIKSKKLINDNLKIKDFYNLKYFKLYGSLETPLEQLIK